LSNTYLILNFGGAGEEEKERGRRAKKKTEKRKGGNGFREVEERGY